MSTHQHAELARELSRNVSEMRNNMRRFIQEKIRDLRLDITFELLEVMALLWRRDGMNQQEIADAIVKDKSSTTYLLDNLVRRKLVTRMADGNDRRNKLIYLTSKGRLLQKKLHPAVLEMYAHAMSGLSASDISNAIVTVKRINENFNHE